MAATTTDQESSSEHPSGGPANKTPTAEQILRIRRACVLRRAARPGWHSTLSRHLIPSGDVMNPAAFDLIDGSPNYKLFIDGKWRGSRRKIGKDRAQEQLHRASAKSSRSVRSRLGPGQVCSVREGKRTGVDPTQVGREIGPALTGAQIWGVTCQTRFLGRTGHVPDIRARTQWPCFPHRQPMQRA
jgi:hypothetical protein